MALKKVKRQETTGEIEAKAKATEAVEPETTVEDTPEVEEVLAQAEAQEAETTEEPAEEVKEEKKETPKVTKPATKPVKPTTAKKEEKKETPKAKPTAKKETPKATTKKLELKSVNDTASADDEEEGKRATKKKVMKLTKEFLEENAGVTLSLENLTTIINAFEAVLGEVTNEQSYKFMDGMIKVQERNGQVFKSPKVDYYSYKAPRVVKTFTQDVTNVPKYRGSYDDTTKVFKADGQWNYDTKEFDPVDIEIVVGQEDSAE